VASVTALLQQRNNNRQQEMRIKTWQQAQQYAKVLRIKNSAAQRDSLAVPWQKSLPPHRVNKVRVSLRFKR
jgi:hypothetical protein